MVLTVPDPCVVLMIGPAGSGKSTLAAALAASNPGAKVVSYDAHQRRLPGDNGWQTCTAEAVVAAHAELAERCAAGVSSIVDGTHRQPERRAAVQAIAVTRGLPVVAVVLDVPLEECLARQHRRARHVVPEDIRAQHGAITEALRGIHREGYAAVIILHHPGEFAHFIEDVHGASRTTPRSESLSTSAAVARVIADERERIAHELEQVEEFCKDYTFETGEVLIPRDVAVSIARTGIGLTHSRRSDTGCSPGTEALS